MLLNGRPVKSWLLLRVAVCAVALSMLGLSGSRASEKAIVAQAPHPITLHVAANPADDITPLIYAKQSGLFEKVGLDVQLQRLTSAAGLPAAVASGVYDIGKTSIVSLFAARDRGLPFTIIAPAGIIDGKLPVSGFIAANASTIAKGRDFNGKVVSVVALHDIGWLALNAWVDQHGGNSTTLQYVELPMSTALAAIEQRRVFAAEIANPLLAEALAAGNVRLFRPFSSIAPSLLLSGWFTTADWANQHREAVKLFAQVLAQAAAYTNAHTSETAALLAEISSIPLAVIEHMPRIANGTRVNESQIQPVIDAAVKYKLIKQAFPAGAMIYR